MEQESSCDTNTNNLVMHEGNMTKELEGATNVLETLLYDFDHLDILQVKQQSRS